MVIRSFPSLDTADEYGLLALGGDLEVESLLLAYRSGIFPWPILSDDRLAWFSPWERAVLFLDEAHISRTLEKKWRSGAYRFTIDCAFEEVVAACAKAKNRVGQSGTWITDEIVAGYIELHRAGHAHSVECYRGEELIGGLYGVSIGKMFAGESMFYRESDASKLSLYFLIEHLRKQGVRWIDCQQLTELLSQFGAVELPRAQFLTLLGEALNGNPLLFQHP